MKHEPELFCVSSSGIYIPQRFATEVDRAYVSGIDEEDYAILENGPEDDYYYDTWDKVLSNARITYDGTTWYLWQDGDLWIVPDEYENNDFFGG